MNPKYFYKVSLQIVIAFIKTMRRRGYQRKDVIDMIDEAEYELTKPIVQAIN